MSEPQAPMPESESESEVTPQTDGADEVISDDLLVEEVSIDGMCGVY